MTDCTGSHGGIDAAEIACEAPDTGSLVIPGSFRDTFDAGDWSHGECGSHDLHRYHAATPEGDTTVRLETRGPKDLGLIDRKGDIQWRYPESIHHDMSVTSRGTVIGLTEGDQARPNPESPEVRFDAFIELGTDGSLVYRWSSAEHHAELAALHPPHPLYDDPAPGILEEYERFLMTMHNRGPIFHDLQKMGERGLLVQAAPVP